VSSSVGVEHPVPGGRIGQHGGPIEAVPALVVSHRHAGVGVPQLELDVTQRQTLGEHVRRDRAERSVWSDRSADAGDAGQVVQQPVCGGAVHPVPAGVADQWRVGAAVDQSVQVS
jgi:hypothetical protein